MTPNECCANSGELRKMIDEAAEKAAERTAENVMNRLRLEMVELEKRLSHDVSDKIDERVQAALGMTPQEHAIQHDRVRRISDFWMGFSWTFWKRTLLIIVFMALAFSGGVTLAPKKDVAKLVDTLAITRDEHDEPSKAEESSGEAD